MIAGTSVAGFPSTVRRDDGFASIVTLAAGAVVMLIGMTVVYAGAATVARHQAQTAADFGALAAAARAELEPDAACDAARQIVVANGAAMQQCRISGRDIIVTVTMPVTDAPPGVGPATATARAGPSAS